MSFACARPGGSGGGAISVPATITMNDSGIGDALTINTDGTFTATNEGVPNWFTPTTASIGNNYWCKMTLNSGSNPTTGTMATVLALSSARAWTWLAGVSGSYTLNFYSDSGGTVLVGTSAVTATG